MKPQTKLSVLFFVWLSLSIGSSTAFCQNAERPVPEKQNNAGEQKMALDFAPPSEQDIKDATVALYVEAVANGSKAIWQRGNDPRLDQKDRAKENVRAICLGQEGDEYVFLSLRFFLDPTYPNYVVQGLTSPLIKGRLRPGENAPYTSYLQAQRLWLTATQHTGGGQIAVGDIKSFSVRNRFELKPCNMVSRFTKGCSAVDGKKYIDPIKGVLTAGSVAAMERELNGERHAKIETFGDHDVVLIKVKASQWKTPPRSLGLKQPSYTIRLLTERQRALFGFKFVLMSQEALNAVRAYKVADNKSGHQGFLTRLAVQNMLDPTWVTIAKVADLALGVAQVANGLKATGKLAPAAIRMVARAIHTARVQHLSNETP